MRRLLAFLLALAAPAAWAHAIPDAAVFLDVEEGGVRAELHLPLSELEIGFGRDLLPGGERAVARYRSALAAYLAEHVGAVAPDERPWTVTVRSVGYHTEPTGTHIGDVEEAVAEVWLVPPDGAPVRRFTLLYDAVVHELISHQALVSVRSDWAGGQVGGEPTFVGRADWKAQRIEIDRTEAGAWRGFRASFALGVHHIAEGTDHLLFLLTLLLPAALVAVGGRWGAFVGWRRGLGRLLRIVTAFTVGHSLTLALGVLAGVTAPAGPVEVVIALSVLVSAVHALRPLFPEREGLVAGLFGLVHGLAFAEIVAGFGVGPGQAALTLLGFNLGIEAVQLAVVAVVAPVLFLLARTALYAPVRIVGATVAGVAALAWAAERALGWANPVASWVEGIAHDAVWLVVGLAVLALAASAWERLQARREPTASVG